MPEFKPTASYEWKEDAIFPFTGKEYEILLHAVRAVLSTPESQKVLLLSKVNELLENTLIKGIESGLVTEVIPPPELAVSE